MLMSVQTAMEAVQEPALTLLARLSAGVLVGLVSETAGFVTTLMSVLGMRIIVLKAARTLLGPLSAPAGLDTGSMPMEGHVMVSATHSHSLFLSSLLSFFLSKTWSLFPCRHR